MAVKSIPVALRALLLKGMVIPAVPLALDSDRRLAESYQRALIRYYLDSGAGGLAVGVHTTQFAIREPEIGLFDPVLSAVKRAVDEWSVGNDRSILRIAGVCGRTPQAVQEANIALDRGYHACLLSLGAFQTDDLGVVLRHCREIASVIPLVGFYLQPAVGGRLLPYTFWREFMEIENVLAVKIAPFNRYQTLDVVRAVVEAGRESEIALYTGNDDNIVIDLLTRYQFSTNTRQAEVRIVGGLLGQWAVWTRKAVEILEEIHAICEAGSSIPNQLLSLAAQMTDANGAIFDAANTFHGCIPGIHYILYQQGLMPGTWCLDPNEILSPGQKEEIERIRTSYPALTDDQFIRENITYWLG